MRKPDLVREATPIWSGKYRKIGTGVCVHCGNVAKKEAVFKSDGFVIIEKYCDDCLQADKFSAIMSFYARTENPAE